MHMKGHVRELFLETVEEYGPHFGRCFRLPNLEDCVPAAEHYAGRTLTWGGLLGLLWNCTDCAPADVCEDLGSPRGSTYAQMARSIMAASKPAII